MIKLILFYTQGAPYDNGMDITVAKDLMVERYASAFDEIVVYSPQKLKSLGYGEYCKEYKDSGAVTANKEQKNIGFCSWKPLICLLELEKCGEEDIIVYHDVNCLKYKVYLSYINVRKTIRKLLTLSKYDFYFPQEQGTPLERYCKLNVLTELGGGYIFNHKFHQVCVNLCIFKNTAISRELLTEWLACCKVDTWIDGELYEPQLPCFVHHCPEQSILNNVLANWIKTGKNGISKYYPFVYVMDRNINRIRLINDYSYLKYLPDYYTD